MEQKIISQESVPKKSLEERIKNLGEWALVAKELVDATLLMCEEIKNGKLGSKEFHSSKEKMSILMNPLAREAQNIQNEREKREREKKNNSK